MWSLPNSYILKLYSLITVSECNDAILRSPEYRYFYTSLLLCYYKRGTNDVIYNDVSINNVTFLRKIYSADTAVIGF